MYLFRKPRGTHRFTHTQLERDGVIVETRGIPQSKLGNETPSTFSSSLLPTLPIHTHTHTHTCAHTHTHTHARINARANSLIRPSLPLFRKSAISYVLQCTGPGVFTISISYKGTHTQTHTNLQAPTLPIYWPVHLYYIWTTALCRILLTLHNIRAYIVVCLVLCDLQS